VSEDFSWPSPPITCLSHPVLSPRLWDGGLVYEWALPVVATHPPEEPVLFSFVVVLRQGLNSVVQVVLELVIYCLCLPSTTSMSPYLAEELVT
jgi:hypothetical protein